LVDNLGIWIFHFFSSKPLRLPKTNVEEFKSTMVGVLADGSKKRRLVVRLAVQTANSKLYLASEAKP
jgi:hypothetical protein